MLQGKASMRRTCVGVCLALLASFNGFGKSLTTPLSWTHYGLRPLGMGNAFVAVVDDYNALFYNPAGLARLKTWDGEFFNAAGYAALNTQSFLGQLINTVGKNSELADLLETFRAQSGKIHSAGFTVVPHLVGKGWGVGAGITTEVGLTAIKDTSIDLRTGTTVVAPMGFAWNFFEDRLSLGASVKVAARAGVDDNLGLQTLGKISEGKLQDLFRSGFGAGMDLGLLLTPVKPLSPTIGVSIMDFGGTVLQASTEEAPEARKPTVNTGFSFKPYQSSKSYLLVAVDGHALNQPIHFSKKFNMGMEFGVSRILKLQTGLSQGYLTGGVQFDVGFLNLRVASWVVDHGVVVGQTDSLAERRYSVQMKMLI
ncbi:MAG: hypothetical protein AB8C84_04055 [Oligoflexales bacterium]